MHQMVADTEHGKQMTEEIISLKFSKRGTTDRKVKRCEQQKGRRYWSKLVELRLVLYVYLSKCQSLLVFASRALDSETKYRTSGFAHSPPVLTATATGFLISPSSPPRPKSKCYTLHLPYIRLSCDHSCQRQICKCATNQPTNHSTNPSLCQAIVIQTVCILLYDVSHVLTSFASCVSMTRAVRRI